MNRRIPNLTFHIGATGSMARAKQIIDILVVSIPEIQRKARDEKQDIGRETGNNNYLDGVIDQLEDFKQFIIDNQ